MYPIEIVRDNEIIRKRQKKAMKTIKKMKYWQYTFSMLTKHIGKGEKNSLKRVKVLNGKNKVIKECQDKLSIE